MDRDAEKQLIKQRVDLLEVVREVVPDLTERSTGDHWGCCPFHQEDTPSFHVRPALGLYKCFGCGESGDVLSFVGKTRGLGFRETLELLAERAGVTLGSLSPEDRQRVTEARRARVVMGTCRELFVQLLSAPEGAVVNETMRARGFTPETLEAFDVGYVPSDFAARLERAGVDSHRLREAGFMAHFRDRIAFGIRDANGSLVGFGARRLTDGEDAGAKYVNTRETPSFRKRELLYGLNRASQALGRHGRLVVMEGYTDVMAAHQAGVTEAVATMGTSFTDEHMALVQKRARNIVFVFDGDEAGLRAAEEAVRKVLAHGRECRVLVLADGQDPGEWFGLGRSREDFDALLDTEGVTTAAFLSQRGLARLAGEPGGAERIADEVLELTRTIRDQARRRSVASEIARECGVDRNLVLSRVSRVTSATQAAAIRQGTTANKAGLRCQAVVVAALATPDGRAVVEQALSEGLLVDQAAQRLVQIGLAGTGLVDAMDWSGRVAAQAPEFSLWLERALLPPPETVLPSLEEALVYLRDRLAENQQKEARRRLVRTTAGEAELRRIEETFGMRASRPPVSDPTNDSSVPPEALGLAADHAPTSYC